MSEGTKKPMMSSGEVARELGVDSKTVARWANRGLIRCIKLPGGHRRYYRSDIEAMMKGGGNAAA